MSSYQTMTKSSHKPKMVGLIHQNKIPDLLKKLRGYYTEARSIRTAVFTSYE